MAAEGERGGAWDYFPAKMDLGSLRQAAQHCKGCDLWEIGTQTVFGEGKPHAKVVLIGEQPGDQEDLEGEPFVGPAGRLLNVALEEAGINRSEAYLTNVVKHFSWIPRGKRRIHQKPKAREISACTPWLAAELSVIEPEIVICLGATAAQTLLGRDFRVTHDRGVWVTSDFAEKVMATIHPSAILRMPDEETRDSEYRAFVKDLKFAAKAIT